MNQQSFTGHTRRRQTRWTVHVVNRLAHWLIAAGGIGTIVAVSLVCVFLVWVVLPLFWPATVRQESVAKVDWSAEAPEHIALDEDQLLGYALLADGSLVAFRPDNGEQVAQQEFLPRYAADSRRLRSRRSAGRLWVCRRHGATGQHSFYDHVRRAGGIARTPATLRAGDVAVWNDAVLTRAAAGQFRLRRLVAELDPPIEIAGAGNIQRIDYSARPRGEIFCVLSAEGRLELHETHRRENLLTGETIIETTGSELPWNPPAGKGLPDFLLLSDQGDHVFTAWRDGTLLDFDTRDVDHPKLGEALDLVPESGQRLTALRFLLGKGTLLAGDSLGRVQAWFGVHAAEKGTDEPVRLVMAHSFAGPPAAQGAAEVLCLACSGNSRLVRRRLCGSFGPAVLPDQRAVGARHAERQPIRRRSGSLWRRVTTDC